MFQFIVRIFIRIERQCSESVSCNNQKHTCRDSTIRQLCFLFQIYNKWRYVMWIPITIKS